MAAGDPSKPSRISSSFATWWRNFQQVSFAAIQNGAFTEAHPSTVQYRVIWDNNTASRTLPRNCNCDAEFPEQYASERIEIR